MTPTLAAWLHRLDPVALDLGGPFVVRWYGLSYLLGFLIAYLLIRRVTKVGVSTLRPDHVGDLVMWLAIGVVVGGRLGYVFFYRVDLLWEFTAAPPWWGVLAINQGGMASHGGMIGGIAASGLYAWRYGHRWTHLLDLFAFGAPLGLFFGRLANFWNGELIGRACDPKLPWAVKFPQEMYDVPAVADRVLLAVQRAGFEPRPGVDEVSWVIHQVQRGNAALAEVVAPLLTPRHPSQLYAAALEGLCVAAVLLWAWRRPRRTGLIGSLFCVSYAVARVADEFFRSPDAHLGLQAMQLSRGQWLSFGLLALGVVGLVIVSRVDWPRMGGWPRAG